MKYRGASFSKIAALAIKFCVLLGMLCLPAVLRAQDRGKVEVDKDPKVDSLIEGYLVAKKGTMPAPASSTGYRVQIFSGSDRKGAYSAQAKFQKKYPELRTYLTYHEPNFKVHVGDFRSRLEAEKMMEELKPWFTGLFVIEEKINLPKLDTE
jgi:hypothetical protein